jgi:hypothetical protein
MVNIGKVGKPIGLIWQNMLHFEERAAEKRFLDLASG